MKYLNPKYLWRWIRAMYNRKFYRQSHEGQYERACMRVEKKWQREAEYWKRECMK